MWYKSLLCKGEKFQFSPLLAAILDFCAKWKSVISPKTVTDRAISSEFLTPQDGTTVSYAKGKIFNLVFLPQRYSAGDTYRGSGLVINIYYGYRHNDIKIIFFILVVNSAGTMFANFGIIARWLTADE